MIYPHTYFSRTTRKTKRMIKRERLKKSRILLKKLFKLKKLKNWRRRKKKVTQEPCGYFSFDGVVHPNPSSVSPTIFFFDGVLHSTPSTVTPAVGCFDTNGIYYPYPKSFIPGHATAHKNDGRRSDNINSDGHLTDLQKAAAVFMYLHPDFRVKNKEIKMLLGLENERYNKQTVPLTPIN